jgi:hypothetical protein
VTTSGDNAPRDRPADDQWSYPWPGGPFGGPPGGPPGGDPSEDEPDEPADPDAAPVLLCTVRAAEAEALCARLEFEGIPCSMGAEDQADSPPPPGHDSHDQPVDVFVEAGVLAAARELLARPGRRPAGHEDDTDDDERAFEQELEENRIADWICPRCCQRTLELVPLSRGWRTVRIVCVWALLSPLLGILLLSLLPSRVQEDAADFIGVRWFLPWMLAFVVLACTWALRRQRSCTECGWRTDQAV